MYLGCLCRLNMPPHVTYTLSRSSRVLASHDIIHDHWIELMSKGICHINHCYQRNKLQTVLWQFQCGSGVISYESPMQPAWSARSLQRHAFITCYSLLQMHGWFQALASCSVYVHALHSIDKRISCLRIAVRRNAALAPGSAGIVASELPSVYS